MTSTQKKYPIAERFLSVQGEGLYTGAQMYFIRFAGCSVGKKLSNEERASYASKNPQFHEKVAMVQLEKRSIDELIPVYTEKCCTYDGREFLCDTDFRTKETMTMQDIMASIPQGVARICLTGGEPLMHKIGSLLSFIGYSTAYELHIETSGTIDIKEVWEEYEEEDNDDRAGQNWLWITVSPKFGTKPEMLRLANEIKLLVDDNFSVDKIPKEVLEKSLVWLQPVNNENDIIDRNLQRCLQLQKEHPTWRISTQMHKIWKVR